MKPPWVNIQGPLATRAGMGGGRESTAAISPILSLFLPCAPLFGEERPQIYTQVAKSELGRPGPEVRARRLESRGVQLGTR
jgi:hypothetical protein